MTFTQSIQTCFGKYATFDGSASRSEYWWWYLFLVLVTCGTGVFNGLYPSLPGAAITAVLLLATVLPSIAVTVRRLHDTDRSGWWLLVSCVPVIGALLLFIWCVQRGTPNRYEPFALPA